MTDLIRITDAAPLEGYRLRLWFSDGAVKDVDLSTLLSCGGVFSRIRDDRSTFEPGSGQPGVSNDRVAR